MLGGVLDPGGDTMLEMFAFSFSLEFGPIVSLDPTDSGSWLLSPIAAESRVSVCRSDGTFQAKETKRAHAAGVKATLDRAGRMRQQPAVTDRSKESIESFKNVAGVCNRFQRIVVFGGGMTVKGRRVSKGDKEGTKNSLTRLGVGQIEITRLRRSYEGNSTTIW